MSNYSIALNSDNAFVLSYNQINEFFRVQEGVSIKKNRPSKVTSSAVIQPGVSFTGSNTVDRLYGFQVLDGSNEVTISAPNDDGSGRVEITINVTAYDPEVPLRGVDYIYDPSTNSLNETLAQEEGIRYIIDSPLVTPDSNVNLGFESFDRVFSDGEVIEFSIYTDGYDLQDGSLTATNFRSLDGTLTFSDPQQNVITNDNTSTIQAKSVGGSGFEENRFQFSYDLVDSDGNVYRTETSSVVGNPNVVSVEVSEEPPSTQIFAKQSSFTINDGTVTYTDVRGGTLEADFRYEVAVNINGQFFVLGSEGSRASYGVGVEYDEVLKKTTFTFDNESALSTPQDKFYLVADMRTYSGSDLVEQDFGRSNQTYVSYELDVIPFEESYIKTDSPDVGEYINQNGAGFYRVVDGYLVPVDRSELVDESDLLGVYYCEPGSSTGFSIDPREPSIGFPDQDGVIQDPGVVNPGLPPSIVRDTFRDICTCVEEFLPSEGFEGVDYIYGQFQENDGNNYMNRRGFTDAGDYWIKGKNSSDELIGNGQEIAFVAGSSDLIAGSEVSTADILTGLAEGTLVSTKSFTSYDGIFNVASFQNGTLDELLASGEEIGITRIDAETGEQLGGSTILERDKMFTSFDSAYNGSLSAQNGFDFASTLAADPTLGLI